MIGAELRQAEMVFHSRIIPRGAFWLALIACAFLGEKVLAEKVSIAFVAQVNGQSDPLLHEGSSGGTHYDLQAFSVTVAIGDQSIASASIAPDGSALATAGGAITSGVAGSTSGQDGSVRIIFGPDTGSTDTGSTDTGSTDTGSTD